MIQYEKPYWLLAAALSALAGFVDAIGFIKLGGLFVSFMTGNSTRLAVTLVDGSAVALDALKLIAAFVAGVMIGTMVGQKAAHHRKAAVLGLVTMALAVAATLDVAGAPAVTVVFIALAMGAENTVFQRNGEVSIGVTYMTGTLVKMGQRIVLSMQGGSRWQWLPYFLLWCGFVLGALAGAVAYRNVGSASLWIAVLFAALLTLFTSRTIAGVARP
ncbi:DUF1275 domain-containing protein [Altererythrobacter xixiisoli]|uniref:DUF1275 domain-containing protein n=1 Tax=Croceibacterium xixiisoli TaxID=1476466 RepID=A0A6I4U1B3_9SPHN|nr:YoaK family protein [Croceibacterium xixiisoli]MXP00454.1 DUF1275 domain-containing protein [Croceibacterium xixiisoli]